MVKASLIWLILFTGCASGIADPCSIANMSAQGSLIAADCKLHRDAECRGYAELSECPYVQACEKRADDIGKGCE